MATAEWLSKRMGNTSREKSDVTENQGRTWGSSWGNSNTVGQSQNETASGATMGNNFGGGNNSGGTDGGSWGSSSATSYVNVPFRTPQELFGEPQGCMWVIFAGQSAPAAVYARGYYEHECAALARPNPYVHPVPLLPSPAPRGSSGTSGRNPFSMDASNQSPWGGGGWDDGKTSRHFPEYNEMRRKKAGNAPDPEWGSGGNEWGSPSPAPKPKRTENPAVRHPAYAREPEKPPENPAARHPAYPREPEKPSGVGKYASLHPGYTPDPPKKPPTSPTIDPQGNPFGEDDDASEYDDDT
jgi:hypothetical protein